MAKIAKDSELYDVYFDIILYYFTNVYFARFD